MSDFRFNFDDVLTVHPTVLNIPFEVNKDNYSCSFQLTNKTDRTVAYYVRCAYALQLLMVYRVREDRYVGTILPRSTSTVTLTVILKPTTEAQVGTQWIKIWAHVVKDGVEAEDITRENLIDLTKWTRGSFRMPVVFYTGPAVNFFSAIPENNLLHQSINDEVHGTTSEGKGSESGVRRQLSNEMSSYKQFSDQEIKDATNGLSESSKIGQGGYGTVYKGILHDTEVAIKIQDPNSDQGTYEFYQEIAVLGRVRHPNLVKLIGACVPLHALVYEFLPRGSVEYCLQNDPMLLTWQIRTRIIYEICSSLIFLHSIKPQPVVHGDLKPANILLDANFISKLADFGLCRFLPGGTTTVAFLETENIKGTDWYIDPDFFETKKLTPGCDVYSFGITMLRILTGKVAAKIDRKVEKAIKTNSLMAMFDSRAGKWPEDVGEFLAYMGLACCEPERKSAKVIKDISTGLKDILTKIHIYDVVHDGVKAEDIRENLFVSKGIRDKYALLLEPLHAVPPAANSSSAVPEKDKERLHQHMDWKIRSSGASFGEIKHKIGNQPGDVTSTIDRHPPKVSNNQLSQQHLDSRMSDFHQYKQYPAEFNVEPSSSQSRVNRNYDLMDIKGVKNAPNSDLQYKEFPSSIYKEVGGTVTPNLREEATFEVRTRRETADVQYERGASPGSDDDLTSPGIEGFQIIGEAKPGYDLTSPGIEGFQIIGEAKPGCTLRACGFPTNGTSLCIFQWVRHLENGTRQSIEGATVPDYVVTADDVDTFLAVDCIPMDDNGHQGELVSLFANNQNKITCDQDMQHAIGSHISSGRAIFPVFLLMESSETWEETSLILKRSGYQVLVNSTRHAVIEEKYSPDIYIKVPNGQSTQFVLICSDGTTLPFSTSGASQAYSTDDDIRLRDVIVLTMRYFRSKAVDGKRKGRA